ncbi:MAG: hypothetical protein Q9195_009254 [Heterodermia aff. obscurata]
MPASLQTSHKSSPSPHDMEIDPVTRSKDYENEAFGEFNPFNQTPSPDHDLQIPFNQTPSPDHDLQNPFNQTPSSDHDLQDTSNPFCRKNSSEHTTSTELMSPKLSVTASEYGSELAMNDILLIDPSIDPPLDLQDIRVNLSKPRTDINISEEERREYCTLIDKTRSLNEAALIQAVLPALFDFKALYLDPELSFHVGTRWANQEIISEKLRLPQPDQTLGLPYDAKCIEHRHAFDAAQDYFKQLQPAKGLVTPLLTVEVKGPGGSLDEARLQNRHNGACMVDNIVKLKRAAGQRVTRYRNIIQALTIEITTESVQISCHWTDGKHRCLSGPVQPTTNIMELDKARQLIRNAVDWAKQELRDLDTVLFRGLNESAVKSGKRKRDKSAQAGENGKRGRPKKD